MEEVDDWSFDGWSTRHRDYLMCHTDDGMDHRFGQKDMPDFRLGGSIRTCSHVVYYY